MLLPCKQDLYYNEPIFVATVRENEGRIIKKPQVVLVISQNLFCSVPIFNSSNVGVFPFLYFKEYFNGVICQHRLSKVKNTACSAKSHKWVGKLFAIKTQ